MITPDNLYKSILTLGSPHVKVFDMMDRPLYTIDNTENPEETVNQLKTGFELFVNYGRVKVVCATPTIKGQSWKNAYKYEVLLKDGAKTSGAVTPVVQQASLTDQMMALMQIGQMFQNMSGNNNNSNMQYELLKKEIEYDRKIREYEKANEDPMKKYAALVPLGMRLLGVKTDEIKETMQLTALASQWGATQQKIPATISGPELSTDIKGPDLEEIKKLSLDEMNVRIQNALNQLPDKIGGEYLLALLELLIIKPELSVKAIELYKSGMI